jgi:hypothetical protein
MRPTPLSHKLPIAPIFIARYETNPPIPKAPDRPDVHRGQGFARRFAPKERELRLIYAGWDDAKVVEPSKVLELRASQGRFLTPSPGRRATPLPEN